jgi:hypothetical protein
MPRRSTKLSRAESVVAHQWPGLSRHRPLSSFNQRDLLAGAKVEAEHVGNYMPLAKRIAADHLTEDPNYYRKAKRAGLSAGRGRSRKGSASMYQCPKCAAQSSRMSMVAGACPPATTDVALNLQNRQKAIEVADYGPANPRLPNDAYWRRIASQWRVPVSEAKTMRCGNCAAFNITPEVLDCIASGLSSSGVDPADTIVAAELGYCEAFKFKCAASRTCSAWIVGGPIRLSKKMR